MLGHKTIRLLFMFMLASAIFLAIFAMAGNARADEITFANGDRISGKVIRISDATVQIATEYAGEVSADFGKVVDMKIDTPGKIVLKNGDIITGTIELLSPEFIVIERQDLGTLQMPRGNFHGFMVKDATPDYWSGSFAVGAQLQRGNTDTADVHAEFKATRKAPREELNLRFYSDYGETEGETDQNKVFGQAKLKIFKTDRLYLFGVADMEYDEMEELDLRAQGFGGLGYKLIARERTTLLGEAGAGLTGEFFDADGDEENLEASVILNAELTQKLFERVVFYQGITLFPSLGDFGEFRVRSESTLTSPLGDGWAIKLSLVDDYDSDPENDAVKKNDLRFISALEYTF